MGSELLPKWRRWLGRIYHDQLSGLLIDQHTFKQFTTCIRPYEGTQKAADLAEFLNMGYVAVAATAIRRMVEEPQGSPREKQCPECKHRFTAKAQERARSISMVILLRDLQKNSSLLTIERFRRMYQRASVPLRFADREFRKITGDKRAPSLSADRIKRDIEALQRAAKPIRRLVNKVIAHTEEDRRRIPKVRYRELDKAIELLKDLFRKYSLLINGSHAEPLVPLHDYDVSEDLERVWPPKQG